MATVTPRTMAIVVGREQAESIVEHIQGSLEAGAGSMFLYTTLDEVPEDPQSFKDFPRPDVYIFQAVYVIGMVQHVDDLQAQISEHTPRIDQ